MCLSDREFCVDYIYGSCIIFISFQIALSVWLNKGDDYKKMLQNVTQARIVYELYNRISPEKQIELYQVCVCCVNIMIFRVKKETYNIFSPVKVKNLKIETLACFLYLLQQECIMAIVSFIQKNPRASEGKLVTEISKHVEIFKQKVATL